MNYNGKGALWQPDSRTGETPPIPPSGSGTSRPVSYTHLIWQNMGWSSIIYLAALAGVDQELHEAAMVDGANKLKRIIHIDLPAIMPTMVILLIMNAGNIMSVGYEKVYLMQNDLNLTTAEVISTYVYKIGLKQQQYSYSAAIGLFNNAINFFLLVVVNKISKKVSGSSLW